MSAANYLMTQDDLVAVETVLALAGQFIYDWQEDAETDGEIELQNWLNAQEAYHTICAKFGVTPWSFSK